MKHLIGQFDPQARALEKQQSRDLDADRMREGAVSPAELRRDNGIGSRLPLSRYKMSAIGGKPID